MLMAHWRASARTARARVTSGRRGSRLLSGARTLPAPRYRADRAARDLRARLGDSGRLRAAHAAEVTRGHHYFGSFVCGFQLGSPARSRCNDRLVRAASRPL